MYTPTQNYGLAMPSYGDEADIGVINDMVTSKVDELLFQNRTISAPPFETTEAYTEGDLVVYENVLYRFTADKAAGAWDSSKVVQTSLADEIESKGSGASALSDLTDTDIDTPANGEVLTWDGTAWVNAEGTPAVTKTATGNPIEIQDGANAPLVKCTTEIQGSQDLHGYDKPWVGGAGKNKFGDVIGTLGVSFTNGGLVNTSVDTFANFRPKIFLYKDGNAVYQLSMDVITSKGLYTANIGDGNASYDEMQFKHNGSVIDLSVNVKMNASGVLTLSFYCDGFNPTIVGGIVVNDIQVEVGSTATTYEPYSNICPITAYTEGEIEVSDGDGNVTTHTTTYPSAIYRGSEDCVKGEVTTEWGVIASYAGETLPGEWISDRDEYAPGTTPTTGAQVAYELATPTTAPVAISNAPIKSLSGYNHIESTTGEMEVEYITEGYQPLVDLIQGSQHVYSTQEQIVGKWVDGSDIYEKSIDLGSFSVGSGGNHTVEQSTDINLLIDYDGYVIESGIVYALPDPSIRIKLTSDKSLIFTGEASWDVTSGYLTIRYTKSTATNRTLAKGTTDGLRADLSEEKKKIEELPETEENTVKKAQSEGDEVTEETKEEADETEGNADEVQNKTIAE